MVFLRRVDTKEVLKRVPEHPENSIMPLNVGERYTDISSRCLLREMSRSTRGSRLSFSPPYCFFLRVNPV